jgi:hypothetical protein
MSRGFLAVLVALTLSPLAALAYPDGWDDSSKCSGSGCHGNAGDAAVDIAGPATLMMGETATYTISFTPQILVGTGISAELFGSGGTIAVVDSGLTKILGSAVTHKKRNAGVYSYQVDVTAPNSAGVITLQAAMLAYNDANGSGGDVWNKNSTDITVQAPEPGQLLLATVGAVVLAPFGISRSRRRA